MFLEVNDIYQQEECEVIAHRMQNPERIKLILKPGDDRIRLVFSVEQAREIAHQLTREVVND